MDARLIPWIILLCLTACQSSSLPSSCVRISQSEDPQTLDPRRARDLPSATVLHMLYEGLMHIDKQGQPQPAIAESYTLSDDQKVYTFFLRPSLWSNGSPLTAYDFEQTWKSALHPHFPSPNAYQFYIIRGAQAAKQGQIPIDQVGIKAVDELTLVVELNHPLPYFLNLVASHFYYPVNALVREGQIKGDESIDFISNGPFKLSRWKRTDELVVTKNSAYWDQEHVRLEQINLIVLNELTALHLFEQGELEWVGSPLSTLPTDTLSTLKQEGKLETAAGAGTHWFRINTESPPFDQPLMRQAFTLALNRKDLINHVLQGNQTPAQQLVPVAFGSSHPFYQDNDTEKALDVFYTALKQKQITKEDLPLITIHYRNGEPSHKIAQVVQQQWKQVFGIPIVLQSCESKLLFDRLKTGDYQLILGSWYADYRDPSSFLEVFKFKNNGTNNTRWESLAYQTLLENSQHTSNPSKRSQLLYQAEKLLMEALPVIPIFHNTYNYLSSSSLQGVYFSELGYLDFKEAYLK